MQSEDGAWSRSELTLRLTRQRAANLRAIAARLPGSPTPTQALDHAIATALASKVEAPFGLDADQLATAIEPLADQVQTLSDDTRARLDALEGSLAKLVSLISDAVGDQEGF
jgi:hypothetical protein